MTPEAKFAVRFFYGGIASMFILAAVGNLFADDIPLWFKIGAVVTTTATFIGQVFCWRAGWRRYNSECAPFAGKRLDKFIVYVLFAPLSLPFTNITFPRWGF